MPGGRSDPRRTSCRVCPAATTNGRRTRRRRARSRPQFPHLVCQRDCPPREPAGARVDDATLAPERHRERGDAGAPPGSATATMNTRELVTRLPSLCTLAFARQPSSSSDLPEVRARVRPSGFGGRPRHQQQRGSSEPHSSSRCDQIPLRDEDAQFTQQSGVVAMTRCGVRNGCSGIHALASGAMFVQSGAIRPAASNS